jgi:hypothetical protein
MINLKNLESEKAALIELCKDFNQEAFAAIPIETLVGLLNHALQDEFFNPEYVRDTTYRVTSMIKFIATLHESVELINHIESLIEQSKQQVS